LYRFLQRKNLKMNALMTDTDSFSAHIPDFFSKFGSYDEFSVEFNKFYRCLDTSFNKPEFQDPTTHEALCFLKNETKNVNITSFQGICSKVYSYIREDEKEVVKAKGISAPLQRKFLSHQLYKDVVEGVDLGTARTCEFGAFSAKKLAVETARVSKKFVTLVDIKAFYGGKNGVVPLVFGSKEHLATFE